MVTKLRHVTTYMTTQMISTHDLQNSSWYQGIIDFNFCVTIYLDIKSSSILISALPFQYHDYVLISFIIEARVFRLLWALGRCLEIYQEDYFQINAYPDSSGGGVRGGYLDCY